MRKIFVAGHNGMVGKAICREISKNQNFELIVRSKKELDLTDQKSVAQFFQIFKPDEVILAAAKVGGIHANNTYPADFIYQNLQIQANVIHFSHIYNVKKLLFLGSSCIYPKLASQPIHEEALLTNKLESTNEAYAIAKISGLKMCESYNKQYGCDYRSIMPTNLYGPGDNYHPENSHVLPALLRRFHQALVNQENEVLVWGTGEPKREFLHVDDMAAASLFIHNLDKNLFNNSTFGGGRHINVGTGEDITINELANKIKNLLGYKGLIKFDKTKPNGPMRKLLDVKLIKSLGWEPKISLDEGLKLTYRNFIKSKII